MDTPQRPHARHSAEVRRRVSKPEQTKEVAVSISEQTRSINDKASQTLREEYPLVWESVARDNYASDDMFRAWGVMVALRAQVAQLTAERDVPKGMRKVSDTIAYFQDVLARYGDSCVYIRTGGCSWGAVALNRKHADELAGDDGPETLLRTALLEHAEYRERVGPIVLKRLEEKRRAEIAQRELTKVLGIAQRLARPGQYLPWAKAGGSHECAHGRAAGVACEVCDLDYIFPTPTAETEKHNPEHR